MPLSPTIGTEIAEDATMRSLAFAMQRVDVDFRHRQREARRHSGACFSGLDAGPVTPPTCRDYIAAAEASSARCAELDKSNAWKAKVEAIAFRKRVEALHQQIVAVEDAISRGDGSGVSKVNAMSTELTDMALGATDLWLAVWDAENAGEAA